MHKSKAYKLQKKNIILKNNSLSLPFLKKKIYNWKKNFLSWIKILANPNTIKNMQFKSTERDHIT